jgi:uncharacterized protein with von Willebrand factor type A (vWA) domain
MSKQSAKQRLRNRVTDLFKKSKRLPELSTSVVKHDRLDDGVLDDMIEKATHFRTRLHATPTINLDELTDRDGNLIKLTKKEKAEAEKYVGWGDLFGDSFRALHTLDTPEILPSDQIKPSRELNRRIMSQVIANEEFQDMRPETRHDEIASAFAAMALADGLEAALNANMQQFVLEAKRMADKEESAESAEKELQELRNKARAQGELTAEERAKIRELAEQKTQARQELAEQQAESQSQGIGSLTQEQIDQAVSDANEAANALSALPGKEMGAGQNVSPDEMIALAQQWRQNPDLFEMAKMIGRMQRDIRYTRTNRVVGGREEIIDVTLGDDLSLLLPLEKVKLKNDLLRRDFFRRFYERSLIQYETQGNASAGRGPLIICIDGSGSMGGMPNVWARSVALSFITIAKKEKRDAAAVEFSARGQVKRWDFMAKEPVNPLNIIDFASHMFHGGTDITQGIESSKELIDQVQAFKSADIVVITDGQDGLGSEDYALRDSLRSMGVRLHGVTIGQDARDNRYLQEICDTTVSAYDLGGSNSATAHLAEAIS